MRIGVPTPTVATISDADWSSYPFSAKTQYSSVKNITVSIKNAVVVENSLADLERGAGRSLPECKTVLDRFAKKKVAVYAVWRVLRADVVYGVVTNSKAQLSVEAKKKLLAGLTAELGAKSSNEDSMTISGQSLHWGLALARSGTDGEVGPRPASFQNITALPAQVRKKLVAVPAYLDALDHRGIGFFLPVEGGFVDVFQVLVDAVLADDRVCELGRGTAQRSQ